VSYFDSVLVGTRRWLTSLIRDGRFSPRDSSRQLAETVRSFSKPANLEDALVVVDAVTVKADELGARSADQVDVSGPVARVQLRAKDLQVALRSALSRRGFSLVANSGNLVSHCFDTM